MDLRDPAKGVSYTNVLANPTEPLLQQRLAGVIGTMVAVVSALVFMPVIVFAANRLVWLVSGAGDEFGAFDTAARMMENPAGMFTRHLGLCSLIGIAFGLIVVFHRLRPRWLNSVQPGFRWRYALICFGIALVVMSFVLWAVNDFNFGELNPQPDWLWFLVVIVVTTPIQAAAEEYFFRGYLLQSLALVVRNRWVAVVFSAAVFAYFHGSSDLLLIAYRFGFGIIAGAVVVATGGLEAAIAAHAVNNLCSFTFAALTSSVGAAITVTTITLPSLLLPLLGFALCGAAAIWVGRKLQIATVTP